MATPLPLPVPTSLSPAGVHGAVQVRSLSVAEAEAEAEAEDGARLGSASIARYNTQHDARSSKQSRPPVAAIPAPDPFTLTFSEALMEQKFRFYFFHKRLASTQCMGLLLLLVLTVFTISEQLSLSHDRFIVLILRCGIQLPVTLLWSFSTFTQPFLHFNQQINTTMAFTVGAINIVLAIIGGEPDHGAQMIYYFFVYMFLQLRFLNAAAVCWPLCICWVVGVNTFVDEYTDLFISAIYVFGSCLALMVSSYFVEYWLRIDFVRHHLLIVEERKTNDLLATLLPDRITEQLRIMASGCGGDGLDDLIAEDHPNVSILFSDIVGFTAYSATISAREVVGFLSNLYTILDYLTTEHDVLKVETIGDAYFVSSGVLVPREDHATLLSNFAFAMLDTIRKFKLKGDASLHMRIGMHSGRVIAGVVGLKVPRYHLFGPTVQLASWMEQTGKPDRIHISETIADDLARWTDERGRELYHIQLRTDQPTNSDNTGSDPPRTYWLTDARPADEAIPTQPIRSRVASLNQHATGGAVPPPSAEATGASSVPPNTSIAPSRSPSNTKVAHIKLPSQEYYHAMPSSAPLPTTIINTSASPRDNGQQQPQQTLLTPTTTLSDEMEEDDANDAVNDEPNEPYVDVNKDELEADLEELHPPPPPAMSAPASDHSTMAQCRPR